jgi:hypothetical protein
MSQNVIAALILVGAILILSVILYLNYRQRQKVRARVEKERQERETKELHRKLKAKQREAGNILFAELSQAAIQNEVSNVLESGLVAQDTGRIEVERIVENGGGYSIFVIMPDPTVITICFPGKHGYNLCSATINLEKPGREIRVNHSPYGPERYYSAGEFDEVSDKLYEWVRTYRMFSEPRPKTTIFQPPQLVPGVVVGAE